MKEITTENILRNYFRLADLMIKYPDLKWRDVYSQGQLESKVWLIENLELLKLNLGTVFLCGGWYASLANIMFMSQLKFDKIRSFDIDPSCADIADTLNRDYVSDDWKFKASTVDIQNFEFTTGTASDGTTGNFYYNTITSVGTTSQLKDSPDTFINTSCEHIENFNKWYNSIPSGKLVVLQSNDYFELEEHINCVKDIKEFKEQCPMQVIIYSGAIKLQKYNRFMLIGIK